MSSDCYDKFNGRIIEEIKDQYGKTDYQRKTDKSVKKYMDVIGDTVGFPHHDQADEVRKQLSLQRDELLDLAHDMWGLVCNVHPQPEDQSKEWYEAFKRVRARFSLAIKSDFES